MLKSHRKCFALIKDPSFSDLHIPYSDCQKNVPVFKRFFLQPLMPQFRNSEHYYEKRYKRKNEIGILYRKSILPNRSCALPEITCKIRAGQANNAYYFLWYTLKWFQNLRSRPRARRLADWKRSVHVSTWVFQFAGQRSYRTLDGILKPLLAVFYDIIYH